MCALSSSSVVLSVLEDIKSSTVFNLLRSHSLQSLLLVSDLSTFSTRIIAGGRKKRRPRRSTRTTFPFSPSMCLSHLLSSPRSALFPQSSSSSLPSPSLSSTSEEPKRHPNPSLHLTARVSFSSSTIQGPMCADTLQNLSRTKSSESKTKSTSPSSTNKPTPPLPHSSSSGPSSPLNSTSPSNRSSLSSAGPSGFPGSQGASPSGQGAGGGLGGESSQSQSQVGGIGAHGQPTTPRRSPGHDGKTSPAPPLVVISGAPQGMHPSEMPSDPIPHSPHGRGFGSPERMLGPDGQPTPPKAGPLNRLRGTPKDTIPIVGKTPRKQRSSRFYVTEKVDIEKLPNFAGECRSLLRTTG